MNLGVCGIFVCKVQGRALFLIVPVYRPQYWASNVNNPARNRLNSKRRFPLGPFITWLNDGLIFEAISCIILYVQEVVTPFISKVTIQNGSLLPGQTVLYIFL